MTIETPHKVYLLCSQQVHRQGVNLVRVALDKISNFLHDFTRALQQGLRHESAMSCTTCRGLGIAKTVTLKRSRGKCANTPCSNFARKNHAELQSVADHATDLAMGLIFGKELG